MPAGESDDLEFGIRSAISRPPAFSRLPRSHMDCRQVTRQSPGRTARHLVERHVIWVQLAIIHTEAVSVAVILLVNDGRASLPGQAWTLLWSRASETVARPT